MKKNLLVSFLFFLFVTGTYAQHFESLSECKSIEDTLRYLQHTFLEPKDKFVGKPAKEVIEAFRKVLPIKSAVLHRSSPWIDKEGLLGIFKGGLTASSAGICGALVFGYLSSLVFQPKLKE